MFRNQVLRTLTVLAVLAFTAAPGYAGTITYDFAGTGAPFDDFGPEPVAFELIVSNFVNPPANGSPVFFSCAQLESSTNCGLGVFFSNQSVLGAFSAQLQFDASNDVGYAFFFPTGAFGAPGSYNSGGDNPNVGTLTVSSTPEPTSAFLFITGVVLLLLAFTSRQGRLKLGRR